MPEFKIQRDVENWLKVQPHPVCIAIAARSAMRVLPFIGQSLVNRENLAKIHADIVLPIFRANSLSWFAAKYPNHDKELRTHAAAADAACLAASQSSSFDAAPFTARHTAASASRASASIALASSTPFYALASAATAFASASAAAEVFSEISQDADVIELGEGSLALVNRPLWPNQQPQWFKDDWQSLTNHLLAADENWQVWTDWFNARIAGYPANQKLELARATLENEIWNQGPKVVNAHIQGLIDEFSSKPETTGKSEQLLDVSQRPAAFNFQFDGSLIRASAVSGHPENSEIAEQTRQETLDRAMDLLQRLEETQAPPRVRQTISRLVDALGNSIDDVKPGILLARSRSLAADAAAFDTEDARRELFPDAISMMQDLLANVEDLKAQIPEILEIEAQRLAQQLSTTDLTPVQRGAEQIIDIAKQESFIIDSGAIVALEMSKPDIAETNEIIETSLDDKVIADAHKNRALLIGQWMLDIRNFAAAILKATKGHVADFGSEIEKDLGKKLGKAFQGGLIELAKKSPQAALVLLVGALAGPLASLAAGISIFTPFAQRAKEIEKKIGRDEDDETVQLDA